MKSFERTNHAKQRMQQRAIDGLKVELIKHFGDDHLQKGGTSVAFISERKLRQLRAAIDKLSGVQIVKSSDEVVITAMHSTKRSNYTEYAA